MQPESPNNVASPIVPLPFNPTQTAEEFYSEWETLWLSQNKELPTQENLDNEGIDVVIKSFGDQAGEEWLEFLNTYLHSDKPHERYFSAWFLISTATRLDFS